MEVCFQCGGSSHLLIHCVGFFTSALSQKHFVQFKKWIFFSWVLLSKAFVSLGFRRKTPPFWSSQNSSQSVSQSGWCYNCYWIFQDKIFVGGAWNFPRDMETKWEQCGWHGMISIQIQMWCASCTNLLKQALILSSSRF
jgi:hypothetical protein